MNRATQNSKILPIKLEIIAISWQRRLFSSHNFLLISDCGPQSLIGPLLKPAGNKSFLIFLADNFWWTEFIEGRKANELVEMLTDWLKL